jgi:predicted nucleic acid-binding protein
MSYLLDTCVISELIRPRPTERVVAWMRGVDESALYLSVLTMGELHKGIAKLPTASTKKRSLARWVDDELVARFANRILPITHEIAEVWGRISGVSEKQGKPLPVIDALLSATALENKLTLVTRNAVHFERAGARILNPWKRG